MMARSIQVLDFQAASTPSGTPTTTANTSLTTATTIVGVMRCPMISDTATRLPTDSPRSPRASLPTQVTNCTWTGLSRSSDARIALNFSGVA